MGCGASRPSRWLWCPRGIDLVYIIFCAKIPHGGLQFSKLAKISVTGHARIIVRGVSDAVDSPKAMSCV